MKQHTFASTSEAYDATQWNDEINDGDVLLVPSEHVAGVLVRAWPVAVFGGPGAFHVLADGMDWSTYENGRYVNAAAAALAALPAEWV